MGVITIPTNNTPPIVRPMPPSDCPWLTSNPKPFELVCNDGTKCVGWKCCNCRGGRAQCPMGYAMCNLRACGGGDYCCSTFGCAGLGGDRTCPDPVYRKAPEGEYKDGTIKMNFDTCGSMNIWGNSGSCLATPYLIGSDGAFMFDPLKCLGKFLKDEFQGSGTTLTYLGGDDAVRIVDPTGQILIAKATVTKPPLAAWKPNTCGTVGQKQFGCRSTLTAPMTVGGGRRLHGWGSPWGMSGVAKCMAWGDPHFSLTFDSRRYDFQGLGVYKLASTLDGSFEIQGYFVPYAKFGGFYRATIFAGFAVKIHSQTLVIIKNILHQWDRNPKI